jgi:hypothetical protein
LSTRSYHRGIRFAITSSIGSLVLQFDA